MIKNTHTSDLGVNVEGRGLVVLAPGASVDGEPQMSPVFGAWVDAGMIEHGGEDGDLKHEPSPMLSEEEAARRLTVEIPDDWKDQHHAKTIALAKDIAGDDAAGNKAEAIAVVENELTRRSVIDGTAEGIG